MSLSNKRPAETGLDEEHESSRLRTDQDLKEEEEDECSWIDYEKRTKISWETPKGTYTAHIDMWKDLDYNKIRSINAKLKFEKKAIGRLKGTILQRPSPIFDEMADSVSEEFEWFSSLFCNRTGKANRIKTDLDARGVQRGGFFHIDEVEIDISHKGQGLGLRLVHEVFLFCKEMWNLAVLKAYPLLESYKDRLGKEKPDYEAKAERKEWYKKFDEGWIKICRHWARLGFKQAGRNDDVCEAWYLTSTTYFDKQSSAHNSSYMWKTKEELRDLDIYFKTRTHVPEGADKELRDLV